MGIKIYNVLAREKEPFAPIRAGEVGIYVCGVTVYGRSHVGHLRCYLSFDAILRYLAFRGFDIKYVRNFTDIDDKIIARAGEIASGPDGAWRKGPAYERYDEAMWKERLDEDVRIRDKAAGQDRHLAEVVSDYFIDIFHDEDFGPFDLLEPMSEPRVSAHIPEVVALIEKIIVRGFAYAVAGDVYFDVPAYQAATGAYGKLSGRDYTQLIEGARVAPTEKKHHAPDFALWKESKPGEPAWDSPWGKGRPGWHIECSAMSVDKLGIPFDIHGGGKDLIFPHHENEIAQSEAAHGTTFCHTWMHNGFLTVDGVKMSKSLGNFLTIKEALAIAPPEVWRLLILGTHYAHPIDLSRTREVAAGADAEGGRVRGTIDIAWDRLEYFYETMLRSAALLAEVEAEAEAEAEIQADAPLIDDPRAKGIAEAFIEMMDDDFNTARATAGIGESMKYLNELCDMKAKAIKKLPGGRPAWLATITSVRESLLKVCGVLGLLNASPPVVLAALRDFAVKSRGLDRDLIEAKIGERETARVNKDFERSDRLRDELTALCVAVRDTPKGPEWKVIR